MRWWLALIAASLACDGPEVGTQEPEVEGDCPVRAEAHGGRAMSRPAIVNAYWGRYWQTPLAEANAFLPAGTVPRDAWDAAWSRLAASPAFWAPTLEYGVGVGSWGGSTTLEESDERVGRLPEIEIHAALERAIAEGRLPDRGDAIHVVYLPPGLAAEVDFVFGDSPRAGHHWYHDTTGGGRRVYAVIQAWNATMGGPTLVASHEIAEAATDPDFQGYYDTESGAEVGNLCVGYGTVLGGGDTPASEFFFRVQGVWSQASCACSGALQ
jgi:hypothetical protein